MAVKISYHEYLLSPLKAPNSRASDLPRKGALLCIDGGFVSLQPWPEFGDLPLPDQLSLLKKGELTRLTERCFHYAAIDREARAAGKSLFSGLTLPKSHHTVVDLTSFCGSDPAPGTYKIKIGRDPAAESGQLNKLAARADLILRLDANGAFSTKEALSFWHSLSTAAKQRVEFLEDPVPYEQASWQALSHQGLPLAFDHYGARTIGSHYDVRVVKPLVQDAASIIPGEVKESRKIVITSAMDHPLGQVIAAWEAARFASLYPGNLLTCGVLSHTIYQPNNFSASLRCGDDRLEPPAGFGFGFDELLHGLSWTDLVLTSIPMKTKHF